MTAPDPPADAPDPPIAQQRVPRKPVPIHADAQVAPVATTSLLEDIDTIEVPKHREQPQEWWPWWWWEIGGSSLSVVGCGLLVVFLAMIDQTPRASWSFSIEPNTLLAIISTITKTTLMVPVVSCISQLKWRHFARPRQLSHLDLIDRCSRGPWGSFLLLLDLWKTNVIISVLALVTIVALGVDPSVQQILETRTRRAQVHNASAEVSYAEGYESKALPYLNGRNEGYDPDMWHLSAAMAASMSDPPQPNFVCPGDYCEWPDYTTLGVCSHIHNYTAKTDRECDEIEVSQGQRTDSTLMMSLNCTYTLPSMPVFDGFSNTAKRYALTVRFANSSDSEFRNFLTPPMVTQAYYNWMIEPNGLASTIFDVILVDKELTGLDGNYSIPAPVQAYRVEFYLCAQTYKGLRAQGARLTHQAMTTEKLGYPEPAYTEGQSKDLILEANSSSATYLYKRADRGLFLEYLPSWLNFIRIVAGSTSEWYSHERMFARYILGEGLETSATNIAATLSTLVQSKDPGDNRNATMLKGNAFINEAYFNVRWPWIVVILVEVLTVVALLATTIVMTWRDDLPKDSAFALLVHGLQGWDYTEIPERETVRSLGKLAETMKARLQKDDEGTKRFVKHD